MQIEQKKPNRWKKWINGILSIVVLIVLASYLEGSFRVWGIISFILIIGGIGLYRLFKGGFFITGLRNIEMAIWGKPLDKELWEKGEMKNTKVEVYLKGKKMGLKNLIPKPKKLTNKHLAATFFAFAIMFFIIFTTNRYTLNIIMAIVMLQFSLYFKTADLVRQNYDRLGELLDRK